MRWLILSILLALLAAEANVSKTLPPTLTPPAQTGVLRIWGHPELKAIVERWRDAFGEIQPDIRIQICLTGSDVAMAGLYTGLADLALLGRSATPSEIQAFEWVYQYKPSSMAILNGGADYPGRSAALSVLVHTSNPLDSLTASQLEALFAFAPSEGTGSISTWGELGLNGDWKNAPIRLYSVDTETGTGRFFRLKAVGGTRHLNWDRLREFAPVRSGDEPASALANRAILGQLTNDRFGLAVAVADDRVQSVKALPLRACEICKAVPLSAETISDQSYPLSRQVNAYFNKPAGEDTDPVVAAFLEYVRKSGQDQVRPDDGYLPLRGEIDDPSAAQPDTEANDRSVRH